MIAYFSITGMTEKMAEYIAEGIRFSGQEAVVRKIEDLTATTDLAGYDGHIFGSPTYFLDVPQPMKVFLSMAQQAKLESKLGGVFGSYTHDVAYKHDVYAPAIIFDIIQNVHKMQPFELGPLTLNEAIVETIEGVRACQDYGRIFGEKLYG